ncbi:MAG: ROK family protein [Dictyoglomi bacterium]|jgi:N-acetylglucosamine kinase|nr:ROK family protein [Dictyoglomota bacterium]
MRYMLAIDGGGTKTEVAVATETGEIISRSYSGPSNWTTTPRKIAQENMIEGIESALKQVPGIKIDLITAGVAGAARKEWELKEFLESLNIAKEVMVTTDAHIALVGALLGMEGIIVIAGTGSISYGRRDDSERRTGGWGYLLGDEGSAYDVGRRGMIAALKAYDGRGEKTLLLDMFYEYLGQGDVEALIRIIYERAKDIISGFARYVVRSGELGDSVALGILNTASYELSLLGISTAEGLGYQREDQFNLAYTGGFFKAKDIVVDPFVNFIKEKFPDVSIFPAKAEPVVGAIILGKEHLGRR